MLQAPRTGDRLVADVARSLGTRRGRCRGERVPRLWVRHGDRVVELLRRGGRLAVRTRDPQAATRLDFAACRRGSTTRLGAAGDVHAADRAGDRSPVRTARDDLVQQATVVGTVDVDIAGARHRLSAVALGPGLALLFHDVDERRRLGALAHRHDDGPGPGRQRRRRLQPRRQPPVRLHRPRHVPGARHGQPHRPSPSRRGRSGLGMRFATFTLDTSPTPSRGGPRPGGTSSTSRSRPSGRGATARARCGPQPSAVHDRRGVRPRRSALIGSPAEVVDKIGRYREAFGHELSGLSLDVRGCQKP